MIRNFKVLGIAVVAALALTAVVASAASAAVFKNPEGKSAKIEATQVGTHVFSVDGTNVTCENATFASAGEIASGSTTAQVHPTYTGCTAFGFLNATVNTGNCDYVVHMTSEVSGGKATGDIDVSCSSGAITITAATCEVQVGSQEGLEDVSTTNNNETIDTVTLEAEVEGISVNKTKDGFLCPLSGTGAGTGTYFGDTKVIGKNGGTQVDVTVD